MESFGTDFFHVVKNDEKVKNQLFLADIILEFFFLIMFRKNNLLLKS